jgi:hypothetical protein
MSTWGRPWKLVELSPAMREQAARLLAAPVVAGRGHAKPQPDEEPALGGGGPDAPVLVDLAGPVHVRLTRVGGRLLDGDNLQGGSKQLRDAIASALGRRGDSDADGMFWEYAQRPVRIGEEAGTLIEVFREG